MRTRLWCAAMAIALAAPVTSDAQEAVEFTTADSVRVFAYAFEAGTETPEGVIVLFHQAGANARAEYDPIVPRLTGAGYAVLAVDQRSGGGRAFGGENQTAAAYGAEAEYCEAGPDLAAALDFVREHHPGLPVAIWGSSYSAALVLRLAAERGDDVDAVLAFSPASGGPMADCRGEVVSDAITAQVLVLRPAREMEVPSAAAQAETFREQGHTLHVADPGSHGSSMLVAERVEGGDVEPTWSVVLEFLDRALGGE